MSEAVVIEAAGVGCALGERSVLAGASVRLLRARVTALLGPSGSGKSTLLRVLAGLEDVEAGEVRIAGRTVSAPGRTEPPEGRDLSVVFQDFALFPHLTALENVAFGLTRLDGPERRVRAGALLDAAGLAERAAAYPHELSGGEQQRVAVARALAPGPAAVLMDEPFSNLDAGLRREARDRAMALLRASGAAVLLVTHDAEEALSLADEVALMLEGRIVQTGAPEEVYARPVSARAAALTGDVNVWRGRAEAGALETPFGTLATDLADGVRAIAFVRPDGVGLAASGGARVTARRRLGAFVEFDVEAGGAVWRARAPSEHPARPGDRVAVTIASGLASVRAED